MKIGYLVPEFPGQTHTFFWREITALERLGAEVVPISTRPPPAHVMPHGWAREAAARTQYLAPLAAGELPALAGASAAAAWRLRRDLREAGPKGAARMAPFVPFAVKLGSRCRALGLSHLHVGSCGQSALIAALCRRSGGPSYSLTLHNPVVVYGPLQPYKWRHAAFGSAITRAVEADLRARYGPDLPGDLFVQSMGVDPDRFRRSAPYAPFAGEGAFRIFCCGRLNRVKGHEDLVTAVAQLHAEGIRAELVIAGEDDAGGHGYRRQLEDAIARSGIDDAVTLLGAVSEDRVLAELETAHVFCLASHAEPLGVAYMEAMACEVPVIGTRAGGVPELIEDGENGLMTTPRDPTDLAAALRRIARDADLARRLGESGRHTVEIRFRSATGAERIFRRIEHHLAATEASGAGHPSGKGRVT